MNKIFLCLLLILSFSCNTKKSLTNEHLSKIKVIKFMGVDMYSHEINKKMFWTYDEEHMLMYMKKGEFLSDIQNYREERESSVKEYIYAFITPVDTLYSDYSLKSWILIRNKKEKYYYDDEGKTRKFLKRAYPFFRDCPNNDDL